MQQQTLSCSALKKKQRKISFPSIHHFLSKSHTHTHKQRQLRTIIYYWTRLFSFLSLAFKIKQQLFIFGFVIITTMMTMIIIIIKYASMSRNQRCIEGDDKEMQNGIKCSSNVNIFFFAEQTILSIIFSFRVYQRVKIMELEAPLAKGKTAETRVNSHLTKNETQ